MSRSTLICARSTQPGSKSWSTPPCTGYVYVPWVKNNLALKTSKSLMLSSFLSSGPENVLSDGLGSGIHHQLWKTHRRHGTQRGKNECHVMSSNILKIPSIPSKVQINLIIHKCKDQETTDCLRQEEHIRLF